LIAAEHHSPVPVQFKTRARRFTLRDSEKRLCGLSRLYGFRPH
jgi:hypothetical protein